MELVEELTVEVMEDFGEFVIGIDWNADKPLTKSWTALSEQQRHEVYDLLRETVRNAIKRKLATKLGKVLG